MVEMALHEMREAWRPNLGMTAQGFPRSSLVVFSSLPSRSSAGDLKCVQATQRWADGGGKVHPDLA